MALFVTITAGMGLVACDQPPAAPSRMPINRPAEPTPLPIRLTGLVVDRNDRPVAGARIAVSFNGRSLGETVADAAGAYAVMIDRRNTSELYVEKEGFEPSRLFVFPPITADAAEVTTNLRLHEILRITAGQSLGLSVVEGDSACSYTFGLEDWGCRRIRVVSPVAGQLTVEATRTGLSSYFIITLPGAQNDTGPHFRATVAAGSETILDVLLIGGVNQSTTLTTRIEPK
jgi:hypothetical protein